MKNCKILVTAAAGKTGSATCFQLLERGHSVRALVRRESPMSRKLKQAGAEVVTANMLDIRDMRRALTGMDRAYFCAPFANNHLHVATVFAAALAESEVKSVTKMTQWFSHSTHPSVYTREHYLIDQLMLWVPHISVATVAPAIFADVYLMMTPLIAQLGVFAFAGDGYNAPVSNEDIARTIVATLESPETYAGSVLRPTGPALIRPSEMAEVFTSIVGKKVKFMDAPESMLAKAAKTMGASTYEISQLTYYTWELRKGTAKVNAPNNVVEAVSGNTPEDFESIATRYIRSNPLCRPGLKNQLSALSFFFRMMTTRAPNLSEFEKQLQMPMINNPDYSYDSDEWQSWAKNAARFSNAPFVA
jgi:NAD(P)H dehydrogenase (quinone)